MDSLKAKLVTLTFSFFLISLSSLNAKAQFFDDQPKSDKKSYSQSFNKTRYIFSASAFFKTDSRELGESSRTTAWLADFRFGYQFKGKWHVTGMYYYDQESIVADNFPINGVNTRSESIRNGLGVGVGYNHNGLYGVANILFGSRWEINENTAQATFSDGIGFQLDFGMHFALTNKFFIGPRLSYRSVTFGSAKGDAPSSADSNDLKKSSLEPYFSLWFEF